MTQWHLLRNLSFFCLFSFTFFSLHSYAESQGGDYKGVTDPFGDPANYEFAEDEKEDKEFFHLGRYLMLGLDAGAGIFTGGLGRTNTPGFLIGARIVYFFDKSFALEASIRYSNHTDTITAINGGFASISTSLTQLGVAFRYYFDTKNAPRAVAIANPYLVFGGGTYMRAQNVIGHSADFIFNENSTSINAFGGAFGGGAEFNVYRKHLYLGADFRYHFVFFPDEDQTFNGKVQAGDRSGDFFSALMTITYNF